MCGNHEKEKELRFVYCLDRLKLKLNQRKLEVERNPIEDVKNRAYNIDFRSTELIRSESKLRRLVFS